MHKTDTRLIDYTGWSVRYDRNRFQGARNAYAERVRTRALLDCLGDCERRRRILDVGCGTGRGVVELVRRGFTNVVGVDFTAAMLQQAKSKLDGQSSHPSRLIRGDAFNLPFAPGSFDVVMSLNFLHMFRFDLQQEILRQMVAACAPGGLVIAELESLHKGLFVTRYPEQRRYRHRTKFNSITEVRRLFDGATFEHVRVRGAVLPKLSSILCHWPALGERIESISAVPPFNWMSSRVVVVGRRR